MRRWSRQLFIALSLLLALPGVASSQSASDPTMTSNNYSAVETEVGGNGCNNASGNSCGTSGHYEFSPTSDAGGATLGESAVGDSASSHYQSGSGFNTTADPSLSMIVNSSSINFGHVIPGTEATATANFDVIDYTSYGYVVTIVGSAPSMGSHTLTNLTTDTSPSNTAEQFGLNAVANTSPSVGACPLQVADNVCTGSNFAYGQAGTGSGTAYAIQNKFRYNSNDASPVASSVQSSGDTRYTLSFLMGVTNLTPGGTYQGNLDIVATGTY
jgi:hypothetical protein